MMKIRILKPTAMGLYESSVPTGTVGTAITDTPGEYWVTMSPKGRSSYTIRVLQCHIDRGTVEVLEINDDEY